jgi:GIY-YIG catalytic domain.
MPIFLLPSKPIHRLKELPQKAGIYYITAFGIVFYVGQAKNLQRRWTKQHQRYRQFQQLAPFGRLHYQLVKATDLDRLERQEIQRLKPLWNYRPVPGVWGLLGLLIAVWVRVIIYCSLLIALLGVGIYVFFFA